MKAIILHTAATNNAGERHDAGAKLSVGDGPEEIALDRAEALLAGNLCAAVLAPKKPTGAA